MSDDYTYNPNPFREDADQESLEERISNISDEEFQKFYRKLIVRLGINRHSDPAFQIKTILSTDRAILLKLLNLISEEE